MVHRLFILLKRVIVVICCFFIFSGFTAVKKVSGTVYDDYIEAIEKVTVKIDDKQVFTDEQGYFSLETDKDYPFTLEFSKEGYETKVIELKEPSDDLEVVLVEL